jgi:hypothetical protein
MERKIQENNGEGNFNARIKTKRENDFTAARSLCEVVTTNEPHG